jgi:ribonuclease III
MEQLQLRLQYRFVDPARLQDALTHRSFSAQHNERLEFLGDSVLNLAVAHLLFERLAALPEGDLSRIRANLVRQDTLHQLAVMLELAAFDLGRCAGGHHWCCVSGRWPCGRQRLDPALVLHR